jgi:hypothetical protein
MQQQPAAHGSDDSLDRRFDPHFAGLTSLPNLVNQILREGANSQRLVAYNKGSYFYSLPSAYARRIESIKQVEYVIGESIFLATYRDANDQLPALAADPEHFAEVFDDWGIAADAGPGFVSERIGGLVGRTLMSRFGWKVGDLVILHGFNASIDIQRKVDLASYSMIIITVVPSWANADSKVRDLAGASALSARHGQAV